MEDSFYRKFISLYFQFIENFGFLKYLNISTEQNRIDLNKLIQRV